jgi:hypothetical protein
MRDAGCGMFVSYPESRISHPVPFTLEWPMLGYGLDDAEPTIPVA